VLGVLVGAGDKTFTTAALLLALLLQRADPGLRAAFLNGPEASLLLATLVTWGCHPQEWGNRGPPMALGPYGEELTWEGAVQLMLDTLLGGDVWSTAFTQSASAALVLLYCYLEPAAPRHVDGQQQPGLVAEHGPAVIHIRGGQGGCA
jgi:hypothetical protein